MSDARTALQVQEAVAVVAESFASARPERQQRTSLERADFDRLAEAGLLGVAVTATHGGLWHDIPTSARPICEIFRTLARGDPSVALVASMHPAVVAFWLAVPSVEGPHAEAWAEQRARIEQRVRDGAWFGTVTSEPGSGGDVERSRTTARRSGDGWVLHGQKHFGSGLGITSWMLTTAVPEGEGEPDWFLVPTGDVPLDGSAGIRLVAAWDGHGMPATQSHAVELVGCPAERVAWPGHLRDFIGAAGPFFGLLFTAVVLGVVESAVELARGTLAGRRDQMRPYEQVAWVQAEMEAWALAQVYDGGLRALGSGRPARGASLRTKTMGAQLAESCLAGLCRVLGGATFSRRSAVGNLAEDVRALGYLRPPWGLAYDGLLADTFAPTLG